MFLLFTKSNCFQVFTSSYSFLSAFHFIFINLAVFFVRSSNFHLSLLIFVWFRFTFNSVIMFILNSLNETELSAARLRETQNSVVCKEQQEELAASFANTEPAEGGQVRVQQRGRTWERRDEGGGEDVPR